MSSSITSIANSAVPGNSGSSAISPAMISAGTGIVGSLISNLFNWFSTKKTNQTNQAINQANLDYNAAMTRESWERDDTAHQREVADLQAAGLSPLANTTGNQVTSPIAAPSPLGMQAPQIDTNSLINSVIQAEALGETKRHNQEIEGHTETELRLKGEQIKNEARSLDIQNKQVEGQIRYYADLIDNEMKTIAETKEHNDEEEYLRRVEYESEQYWKEVKQQVPGNYKHLDIYDFDIYVKHMELWNIQFSNFIKNLGATQSAIATSKSQSQNGGFNASVNVAPGMPGVGAGGNGGSSYSDSSYNMENLSEKQKQQLEEFYNKHPKPVYHMKRWELKK